MPWKISYLFNAGRAGWSETFYLGTDVTSSDAAKNKALLLGNERAKFMAQTCIIDACRITDIAIPFAADYVFGVGNSWTGKIIGGRDQIQVCWMYRVRDVDSKYRRNVYFRGAPDDYVEYDPATGQFVPSADMQGNSAGFLAKLVADGWKIKAISKDPVAVGVVDVQGASVVGEDIVYTATGHGFALKDKVRVSGLKGTGEIALANRTGIVKAVAGATFTFQNVVEAGTVMAATNLGKARRQVTIFVQIAGSYPVRPTKHDTGRAFFAPVGRRRSKS